MTVSSPDRDDPETPSEEAPTIHVTEVIVRESPENDYEYRGLIRSHDSSEAVLLEKELQIRRKPEWLVNVRHPRGGALDFVLLCRRRETTIWQEVGQTTLRPAEHLDDQSSAVAVLALPGWDKAPHLWVQIHLSSAHFEEYHVPRPSVPTPGKSARSAPTPPSVTAAPEPEILVEAPEAAPPLSAQEEVLVKDIWNKLLAFQDLLIEMFFERLLHEEPELIERFGDAIDIVPAYFAEMFDVSIRQLQPHTERGLREGYRSVYPAPPEGFRTVSGYAALLADLGMRPRHWMTARRVWAWMLPSIPYLEEYDRENLALGVGSAPYRFFTRHILHPALEAVRRYDEPLTPEMIHEMRRCGEYLTASAGEIGTDFYRTLFETYPEVVPYFGRSDVDTLAGHLMRSLAFLVRTLDAEEDVHQDLRDLSAVHTSFAVPPETYPKLIGPMLAILKKYVPDFTPELSYAWETLLNRVISVLAQPMLCRHRMLAQARQFLDLIAGEQAWKPTDYERRWAEIEGEVEATGTYTHTYEELAYGAQLAWRNSAKCIGRIAWRNLIVRDLRHVTHPDAMFRECVEHLRMGTNGGNVQIVMSVFRPKRPGERWGPRIWNSQYLRFAGYEEGDGTVLGDGANRGLTRAIRRLGWEPPEPRGPFDLLPLVIEAPGHAPKIYEIPPEEAPLVPIEHPTVPAFAALGLKWCAIPVIANFRMELGGIQYGCVPFNGWFMETEIARNLWEDGRYGKAEAIAHALDLDTSSEQTLWRDRAFLELNVAVLHSFFKARVTLVDHQTASRQFLSHDLREKRAGRECPAQWSWVVPASGGSVTPVWHHEMRDFYLSPHYHYAADKWAVLDDAALSVGSGTEGVGETDTERILILYGSETGTAEGYARQAARRLKRYRPQVMALDECEPSEMRGKRLVLVVSSTFADGDMPANAQKFYAWIREQPAGALSGLSFSVMALGSTVYPGFCAAGAALDQELGRVGGSRVVALHRGDEIKDQAQTVQQWLDLVARRLGEDPTSADAAAAAAEVRLQVSFLKADQIPAAAGTTRQLRLPGVEVPIVANSELLREVIPGSRSTRFIAFDISGTDMTYQTGDHVAIYPRNPAALVQRVCDRLDLDPDAWFTTALVDKEGAVAEGDPPYPEPVTVRQVLTEDLDFSVRDPYRDLIGALYAAASARDEKGRLRAWVEVLGYGDHDDVCRVLKEWIGDYYMNVADLLEAFPSAMLSLEQLIELLPRQKPRLYSIASSALVHPSQIHITSGMVQVVTDAGKTRQGLCSSYLAGLDPDAGATARISVRTSRFRPPENIHSPVLMVGPGTGVSPLIGFLQHREALLRQARKSDPSISAGHARLYFGCRNHNDYLYQQELETWRDTGVLSHLDVAFSRLTPRKIYVQHRIARQGREVWETLSQPDCHLFVCGDAKMSDEVFETLMHIARSEGGLSHAQAVEFFREMHAENRFVTDVWGVTFNFKQSLAEVREARYSQGERWLQRVIGGSA